MCVAVGVLATSHVREDAVAHLPRTEVYEALHRDSIAMGYTITGWIATLILAGILAAFVVYGVRRISS
jgi:hypothetical protein